MTTHYYGYLRTACGRFLPNITEDKSKVTCISCRRTHLFYRPDSTPSKNSTKPPKRRKQ